MKIFVVLALLICAVWGAYDPRFDDFDANAVVNDLPMLEGFIKCLVDQGPCNEIVAAFKGIFSKSLLQ